MVRPSVHFAFAARADDVPRAILLIAKKRAAAMDSLLLVRLSGIQWRLGPLRIARHSAFVYERFIVIRPIPVAAPFPNVSGHVLAIHFPSGRNSSPQTYVFPDRTPRAANSNSASVGKRLPAHFA